MIFADKLVDLRKKSGWSQEELAEKLNVSRQAVSKWEGAQSVPDMARIIQLSELFGVSTDYLLKDNLEPADAAAGTDLSRETMPDNPSRTVGMEEANAFLKIKEENSRRVALGVLLCILSPVALILLGGIHEFGLWNWTAQAATGLGLAILILMILPAVGLFITSGLRIAPYEYLEKEPVETLYGVSGMVKDRKEKFQPVHSRYLITGILRLQGGFLPAGHRPRGHPGAFRHRRHADRPGFHHPGQLSDAAGGRGIHPQQQGKHPALRFHLRRLLVPGHRRLPALALHGEEPRTGFLDRLAHCRRRLRCRGGCDQRAAQKVKSTVHQKGIAAEGDSFCYITHRFPGREQFFISRRQPPPSPTGPAGPS